MRALAVRWMDVPQQFLCNTGRPIKEDRCYHTSDDADKHPTGHSNENACLVLGEEGADCRFNVVCVVWDGGGCGVGVVEVLSKRGDGGGVSIDCTADHRSILTLGMGVFVRA